MDVKFRQSNVLYLELMLGCGGGLGIGRTFVVYKFFCSPPKMTFYTTLILK